MVTTESPRIYVASLSDYNAGRRHGAWIDLDETTDADDIHDAISAILATSPEPIAEEWAIHDSDGFGGIRLDEYESLDRVAALAAAIAEHGDAFAAWATDDERRANPDRFERQYLGHYASREDYAKEYLASSGIFDGVDDMLRNYFDWDAFTRDLFFDVDDAPAPDGGIYVFDPNA